MNNFDEATILEQVLKDQSLRRKIAMESHYWFFHIYFGQYVKYQTADLHRDIFAITEDEEIEQAVIVSFRGSAKSTICATSYPIWAILGKPKKKYILLISRTKEQSRLILSNIKEELENNELLINDFGNLFMDSGEWRSESIVIPDFKARITSLSVGASIRGTRHRENRPDLIICDDIEDIDSVKTQESRDQTFRWFTQTIVPLGQVDTKIILIGNLLHNDSLMMRLKEKILKQENKRLVFKEFPLVDEEGKCLWIGRYPDLDSINREKNKIGNLVAWQREYLLKLIPDEDQVVFFEWLQFYKKLPPTNLSSFKYVAIAVDPAISEKTSADYTAIICAYVFGYGKDLKVYILPNPINKRMPFPTTIIEIKATLDHFRYLGFATQTFVESVAFQKSISQQLFTEGYKTNEVSVKGDKRIRLSLTTPAIQNGQILFPENNVDALINQLVGFGAEKHDDLADAFSLLYSGVFTNQKRKCRVFSTKPAGF